MLLLPPPSSSSQFLSRPTFLLPRRLEVRPPVPEPIKKVTGVTFGHLKHRIVSTLKKRKEGKKVGGR